MGLRIIYGKPGTGKSEYCYNEIAKNLNKENKIYMITPEQFSFTAEEKLVKAANSHAVINAEVVHLSRLVYRVMNEIGGATKTNLTEAGKAMLIYQILNKNKNKLKYLGKSDENIDLVMTAIREFKQHEITIQNLKQEIEKIEDNYLKTKLEDITFIYEKYEEQIENQYIEENDLLTILVKNLPKTNIIKNSIIYFDEFSGFTKQEYEVIKEFVKQAKQVNITICTDDLNINTNPDTDIYYSNKKTIAKIWNMVNENNLELEKPVHLKEQYRFKTKEIKYLSDNINCTKSTKYEKNVENLHLFLAQNPYSEIENIAKQIQELIKKEDIRYKDIAIITKNINEYSSLVRAIFSKYNIPVFIDEKRDLNQNIIVQYILSILEILSKNFSTEAIFNYLKLGLVEIEQDEIFELENYCNKWGIKYSKWEKDFEYDKEKNNKLERLNEIRKQVINPLKELKTKIDKNKNFKEITKLLYEYMLNQKIEEKITKKIEELEKKDLLDLAKEYIESYKIILELFDEIVLIFNTQKTNVEEYYKTLKTGLKNSGLGKIPGTQDQVTFGDVDRSRTHKVKTVFIIGLNDGNFPKTNKDEGFLDDLDREILKEDGIELAKGTLEKLYEDNFNIYKAFTTAENNLYLSYTSSDKEGKPLRPSILIYKIKKLYKNLEEKSEKVEKENNIGKIEYSNLPQKIKEENIKKLYGDILHTSISRLEKYRSCPFSYYLQYGLKLKEKEEAKIHVFDTGSFMHETIDEFFKNVEEQGLKLSEIEDETIYEIVSKIIEENLKLSKNYIFNSTAKYKALVQRLKRIVSKALKYIIQSLIYSDFTIAGTEVEFEPVIYNLSNGKNVEISGKIDRIDTANRRGSENI